MYIHIIAPLGAVKLLLDNSALKVSQNQCKLPLMFCSNRVSSITLLLMKRPAIWFSQEAILIQPVFFHFLNQSTCIHHSCACSSPRLPDLSRHTLASPMLKQYLIQFRNCCSKSYHSFQLYTTRRDHMRINNHSKLDLLYSVD